MNPRCAILGAGSWGTAFATLLAHQKYDVQLWCFEEEVAQDIKNYHINKRYLPSIELDSSIIPITSLREAIEGVDYIFEVIPVVHLRSILERLEELVTPLQKWVILSKGIEQKTGFLPTTIIDDVLSFSPTKIIISGPNFAKELARKKYTASTLTSTNSQEAHKLATLLSNSYFQPFLCNDIYGVQVVGALKNILALTIGIARGSGYSDNTLALLFTLGLKEMIFVMNHFQGDEKTLYTLAGLGDTILTCYGLTGRNQRAGVMIGEGANLQEVCEALGHAPEGINTLHSLYNLIQTHQWKLPIFEHTYRSVFFNDSLKTLLDFLMNQPIRFE